MDEILAKLDEAIALLEGKSVVFGLKGSGDELIGALQTLVEAKCLLRRARSALRQADALLHKGYGEMVEPKDG